MKLLMLVEAPSVFYLVGLSVYVLLSLYLSGALRELINTILDRFNDADMEFP